MTKAVWGAAIRLAIVVILGLAVMSCGTVAREGTASSFLIVNSLQASSSGGGTLRSDVVSMVDQSPTIFDDSADVEFSIGMKDPGSLTNPTAPSQANRITVNRYRVSYTRSDGRNREGVDVPYTFDSAFTSTVPGSPTSFMIVRHQAKMEAPLAALALNGLVISTIAEVTFYGHDQTGRAVSATATMGISFANFGDEN